MPPFEDPLYTGCYTAAYNNWAMKVPNTGFSKTFSAAWPLAGMAAAHHHSQVFNQTSNSTPRYGKLFSFQDFTFYKFFFT